MLARKNHYGSKSLRGTQVAALFYSLVESAKLAGLEPADYLAEATRRAIANPGTDTPCSAISPPPDAHSIAPRNLRETAPHAQTGYGEQLPSSYPSRREPKRSSSVIAA